jgi:hypothetical protein
MKFDRIHENEFMDDTVMLDAGTTFVIFAKQDGQKMKFKAVKSHGYLSQFQDGKGADLVHDQSGARMGTWTVVANVRSTRDAFQLGSITRGYLQDRLVQFGADLDTARFSLAVFK